MFARVLWVGVVAISWSAALVLAQCPPPRLEVFSGSNITSIDILGNLNCSILIVTHPGSVLLIEASGYLPSPSNTHFVLYDGASTAAPVLSLAYGISTATSIYDDSYTTGKVALLTFFSDDYYQLAMVLTISVTAEVRNVSYCSGLNNYLNVSYDGSGAGPWYSLREPLGGLHYLPGRACGWLIEAAPGNSIEFDATGAGDFVFIAPGDSLAFYDGRNASAPLLAAAPSYAFSSSNVVYLVLNATIGTKAGYAGFSFQIRQMDGTLQCAPGVTLVTSGTGIQNPNSYGSPALHYAPPVSCQWIFRVPSPDTLTRVIGLKYSIRDRLVLHDGPTTSGRPIHLPASTNTDPNRGGGDMLGTEMLVEFSPDPCGSYGFTFATIQQSVVPCAPITQLVDDHSWFYSSLQTNFIWSLNEGVPYYGPRVCVWNITGSGDNTTRVYINFHQVALSGNDTVQIYQGSAGRGGTLLGVLSSRSKFYYSGSTYQFTSVGSMHVIFDAKSNGSSYARGFYADYDVVPIAGQCHPYTALNGTYGSFQSQYILPNTTCVWNITITDMAVAIQLSQTSSFGTGILRLYDGGISSSRLLNQITGSTGPVLTTSSGSHMLIVLETPPLVAPIDPSIPLIESNSELYVGFQFTYEGVATPPPVTDFCEAAGTVPLGDTTPFCLVSSSDQPLVPSPGSRCYSTSMSSPPMHINQRCAWHVVPSTTTTWAEVALPGYPPPSTTNVFVYRGNDTSEHGILELSCISGCCTRDKVHIQGDFTVVYQTKPTPNGASTGYALQVTPVPDEIPPVACAPLSNLLVIGDGTIDVVDRAEYDVPQGIECHWNLTAGTRGYGIVIEVMTYEPPLCDTVNASFGVMEFYEPGQTHPLVVLERGSWFGYLSLFYVFESPLLVKYTAPPLRQSLQVSFPHINYGTSLAPVFCSGVRSLEALSIGATIHSHEPFYADKAYPPGTDCAYVFTADSDSLVRVMITPHLGSTGNITLHDGPDDTFPILQAFIDASGNGTVNVTASGSSMFMHFTAGNGTMQFGRNGFTVVVYSVPRPPWCNGEVDVELYSRYQYDMQTTIMQMFGDSVPYPRNYRCVFNLRAPEGTYIVGNVYSFTEYAGDVLTVYEQGRPLAVTSGTTTASFNTMCNTVTIVFMSNNVTTTADVGFYVETNLYYYPTAVAAFPAACRRDLFNGVCGTIDITDPNDVRAYLNCTLALECVKIGSFQGGGVELPMLVSTPVLSVAAHNMSYLSLPALRSVFDVTVAGRAVGEIDLPALRTADSFYISTTNYAPLVSLASFYVAHYVTFQGVVEAIVAPSLSYVCYMYLASPVLRSVAINPAAAFAHLYVQNTNALQSLDFSQSTFITNMDIVGTTLSSINMASLSNSRRVYIQGNGALRSVDMRGLTWVDYFLFQTNPQLDSVIVDSLIYANTISMIGNGLRTIAIPALEFAQRIEVSDHGDLQKFSAKSLMHLGERFSMTTSSVTTIDMNALEVVYSDVSFSQNNYLSVVKMCNIRYMGEIDLVSNPSLSCPDLAAMIQAYAVDGLADIAAPNCNPSSVGTFGCQYDLTYTVDSECGFYVGCIQAQIDAAFSDQRITVFVPEGEYTNCSSPLNFHGKILTLLGAPNGGSVVNCEGHGFAMLFNEGETAQSVVINMTFINGVASSGGLVLVDGASPLFTNCAFRGGQATNGGAVAVLSGGTPTFIDCVFLGSQASTSGGALYIMESSVLLINATITACTAGREGGGLYLGQLSTAFGLSLTNLSVVNCRAQRGGGLYSDSALVISGAVFSGNSANLFGGSLALIPTAALGTNVTLSGVRVLSSSAPSGGGLYGFSVNLLVTHSEFADNVATRGSGGAIFATCSESYRFLNGIRGPLGIVVYLRDTILYDNSAAQQGGALFTRNVFTTVVRGTVTDNSASTGAGVAVVATPLSVQGSQFQGNRASANGGGLYCEVFTGACEVTTSTFTSNYATTAGGGIYLCTTACPGTNKTGGISTSITSGVLPSFGSNSFVGNSVGVRGYGNNTASDPSQLTWLVPPSSTAISGRPVVPDGQALTVSIADGFSQVVRTGNLALSLSALSPLSYTISDGAVVAGSTTVLATSGVAVFPDVTLIANALNDTNADYVLQCQLSVLTNVFIRANIRILPCGSGQGYSPSTGNGIVCEQCSAGTAGGQEQTAYECQPCSPGFYAASAGAASCTPCPVDTAAEQRGSVQCIACAAGYAAPQAGSATCTSLGAITTTSTDLVAPLTGSLAALFLLFILAAILICRQARRRTMKKYYLDQDSTIRTNARDTPVMRTVKKMLVASSTTRIGGGLYADVYKAKYEDRWVAMKVLKGEMMGNAIALSEFQRETVALSQLLMTGHPAIVRLQYFLQRNPMCIGVEFCANGTLKAYLSSGGLATPEKVRLMAEVASGMATIHATLITHLDLKTDNILLDNELHAKICDFGIARSHTPTTVTLPSEFLHESLALGTVVAPSSRASAPSPDDATVHITQAPSTQPPESLHTYFEVNPAYDLQSVHSSPDQGDQFQMAFTPQYVDPVRLVHDRTSDFAFLKQADVYSFAMVLWATMSQAEPFAGEPAATLVERLKADPSIRPEPLSDTVPQEYRTLVSQCWHQNRAARPTFPDILSALNSQLLTSYNTSLSSEYLTIS